MITHLLPDRSPLLYARRRADCARLDACELAWIFSHGGAQAKCPRRCLAFLARQDGAARATPEDMEPNPKHQQPEPPETPLREQPTKREPVPASEPDRPPPPPPPAVPEPPTGHGEPIIHPPRGPALRFPPVRSM